MTAEQIIARLQLKPHPMEGGFFRETYRCAESVARAALPPRYAGDKHFGTAIYYLLTPQTYSEMHRLPTDEVFHFYAGDPVEMLQLWPDGSSKTLTLGSDVLAGHEPQVVVPRGVWQGSRLIPGSAFALLGATMAPAFDYRDYESGDYAALARQYPDRAELLKVLTRRK
jgi:hypothetical protein